MVPLLETIDKSLDGREKVLLMVGVGGIYDISDYPKPIILDDKLEKVVENMVKTGKAPQSWLNKELPAFRGGEGSNERIFMVYSGKNIDVVCPCPEDILISILIIGSSEDFGLNEVYRASNLELVFNLLGSLDISNKSRESSINKLRILGVPRNNLNMRKSQ